MWSMAVCDDNRRQCRELVAALEIYGEENRVAVETEIFMMVFLWQNGWKKGNVMI